MCTFFPVKLDFHYNKYVMQDTQLVKRLKSLAWRSAAMGVAAILVYVAQNAGILNLGPVWTTPIVILAGLIAGEITKYLNNNTVEAI